MEYRVSYHLGKNEIYVYQWEKESPDPHCDLCECTIAFIGKIGVVVSGAIQKKNKIWFALGFASKTKLSKRQIYQKLQRYYNKKFFFHFDKDALNDKEKENFVIYKPYLVKFEKVKWVYTWKEGQNNEKQTVYS